MKLLLTGGSGLVGSKIAEVAAARGYEVYSGYAHNWPDHGQRVKLDLCDAGRIAEIVENLEPQAIVHTAALTDVDRCEKEPDLAFKVNVRGTAALAEAAEKTGSFLVYVSTDYVFSGAKGMYLEEDLADPVNCYGQTKLLGEACCHSVARTCVVFGARPASGKVNFALWIVEKLRRKESIRLVVDQYVTPTLNTNLAEMILELLGRRLEGTYHLAGATRVSRYDFGIELARAFDLDEELIIPARMADMKWAARRPGDSSLDTGKVRASLNCKPWDLNRSLETLKQELADMETTARQAT